MAVAAGRVGKGLMGPLLTVNFVVHLIILGLAGWSLDKYIDGEQDHPHLGGNTSTIFLLIFALLAGVNGACSVLSGIIHLRSWRTHSLSAASTLSIISWALIALALGFVCKEIVLGGHRGKRLQTLEAFIVISAVSQILYLVLLHAGMVNNRFGPNYRSSRSTNIDRYGSIGMSSDPLRTSTPPPNILIVRDEQ